VDIVVPATRKDSLRQLAQAVLNILLPIKGRMEKRTIDVYALEMGTGPLIRRNETGKGSVSFSGEGFDGIAVQIKVFADYLSNELDLPVVDETNLKGLWDIHTENVLRTRADVTAAVEKLGFRLEKVQRKIDVLVLFK
jgi:uncharacterized protein (TIGR03435 family)